MTQIDNYEQFCKAFVNGDEELEKKAKLLLFVQNWIIRIIDCTKEDTLDYSIKKLLEHKADKISNNINFKDALSRIVNDSYPAFRYLNENMREKIVCENVLMPAYKVREVNSYGLNWLSRKSGRTIRQKISSAGNSIMAVQRRMSFDTAENRLFVAFAKELFEQLNTKLESMSRSDQRKITEEEEMRDELAVFFRRADIEEIRRWENLPPNNTLLSDQNYKRIWNAWNELKKINECIKNNSECIEERLATIFFVELLVYFSETWYIPQTPVEVDYATYNIYLCENKLFCLDKNRNTIIINKQNNCIFIKKLEKDIVIEFSGNQVSIKMSGEENQKYEVTQEKIYTYVRYIATKLDGAVLKINTVEYRKAAQKFKHVVIDLFSLHPGYIGDNAVYEKLSERVLQQKYIGNDIDGDKKSYYIPCDNANAIKMISGVTETYTIPYAVDNGSMEQMKRLVRMMENYIVADSFTYVFPDAYNELQLSMVHKAARMVYREVRSIPLSIGAAFKYQTTDDFRNKFKSGDFLLVVNLIDDEVTFTLVASKYDDELEKVITDYKGIVWERHPTTTKLFRNIIDSNIVDILKKAGCAESEKLYKLLGLDGLKEEAENFGVLFGKEWFQITPEILQIVKQFKLNITSAVTEFLQRNRTVINGANIHIISSIDNLLYKGHLPFSNISKQEVLEGCRVLEKLEKLTEIPLWHDHLPALAIKLMYGKFDLIKDARVEPKFDKKQSISIKGTFTLPKQCKEYHFNLVQDENARKMQYEAVIKNPAFPLNHDVECDLLMTYQYGAEEPFELIFIPKDSKTAGFTEAKVKWFRLEKYNTEDLKVPEFPAKISWAELQHYPGRKGDFVNVCDILKNKFDLLCNGYLTVDASEHFIRRSKNGNWYGEFIVKKGREEIKVKWTQANWDPYSTPPPNISVISCWIVPNRHDNEKKRYRIPNLWEARTRDNLWFLNKNGGYQCIAKFDYDGKIETVAIIDQKFDRPDRFNTAINNISFEVYKLANGNLQAINIHDEDGPEPLKEFIARNICEGERVPVPPRYYINAYHSKWIRVLFANNRSLLERECPADLQSSFVRAVNNWTNLFYQYRDFEDKKVIFSLLSLAAKDIGKDYYKIAYALLEMYTDGEFNIPYEIGCAFGDLSNNLQKELMTFTLSVVKEDYEAIGVLAKAIWHDEKFVYNVDPDLLLNKYFPAAVDYIGKSLRRAKGMRLLKNDLENVKYCLELILGVMRLRKLNDTMINEKYLSLNNFKMRELYKYLEIMADNNTKIHSFLKLEISTKGIYERLCDLLYVLFVYVTGNNTEGEIQISLNIDENTDDVEEE